MTPVLTPRQREARAEHTARRARLGFGTKHRPKRDMIILSSAPAIVDSDWSDQSIAPRGYWRVIARQVCEKHGISFLELCSRRRTAQLVLARQEVMYRLRYETTLSYPQIGQRIGGRDHATAIHNVRRHEAMLLGKNYDWSKGRSTSAYREAITK